jgi:hypothetical protein
VRRIEECGHVEQLLLVLGSTTLSPGQGGSPQGGDLSRRFSWDLNDFGILTGYNGIEWDFGGTLRYFHWEHFRKIGDRSSTDGNCVILSMNLGNIIRKTMGIAHHQSASDRACLSQLFSICLICGLEDSPNQPSYSKD